MTKPQNSLISCKPKKSCDWKVLVKSYARSYAVLCGVQNHPPALWRRFWEPRNIHDRNWHYLRCYAEPYDYQGFYRKRWCYDHQGLYQDFPNTCTKRLCLHKVLVRVLCDWWVTSKKSYAGLVWICLDGIVFQYDTVIVLGPTMIEFTNVSQKTS